MSTANTNGIHINCNGTRKRTKLQTNGISDNINKIWTAMEIYCILELTIHSDVRKIHSLNPHLDASQFQAQDWEQIRIWMDGYFGQSHNCWFEHGLRPKTRKYGAQEIKLCAVRIIKDENNGILPVEFNKMVKICEKAKKFYHEQAIKILEQNRKTLQLKLKEMRMKQMMAARTSATTTKCEQNQCKKHLMGMLEKLSKYNVDTIRTMLNKLDTKYKKLFADLSSKYRDATALKVCVDMILALRILIGTDINWLVG